MLCLFAGYAGNHYQAFDEPFGDYPHRICYAVKANANLGVLSVLKRLGAGFDIVSGGELERVLAAGGDPGKIVFSGVGKSVVEIRQALLRGIRCLNLESAAELERVADIARELGVNAPVAFRINPDVDPKTHPYIATGLRESKFGVPSSDACRLYSLAQGMAGISVTGIACHIGSQLTQLAPFCDALERVLDLVEVLAAEGIELTHLDLGGGIGIRYRDETPPAPGEYTKAMLDILQRRACNLPVTLEPGRAIVGNAGVLLTRVEYVKPGPIRDFVIVDAAMNDLLRPALYQAWHEVVEVSRGVGQAVECDVVGPVCETGDFIAKNRRLATLAGDLLAVRSAGAYGFVMSSNYNSRPRPAEVMVDGGRYHVVRPRESIEQLFNNEQTLPN